MNMNMNEIRKLSDKLDVFLELKDKANVKDKLVIIDKLLKMIDKFPESREKKEILNNVNRTLLLIQRVLERDV
jgi:hypothetical protein